MYLCDSDPRLRHGSPELESGEGQSRERGACLFVLVILACY